MPASRSILFALLCLCVTSAPVVAQDEKADFDAATLYKSSCAPCHGLTGDGDGPVADALKAKMEPLSTLAKRHGEFPEDIVYWIIDGRQVVTAHGTRTMPVWGDYFGLRHSGDSTEASTNVKIHALVEYIRGMQVE